MVDTETTTLGPGAEIVEMAVIGGGGDILLDVMVKPTSAISRESSRIHGITAEDVRAAPRFPEIYEDLRRFLCDRTVVAYGADFDRGVLDATCALYHLPQIASSWSCVHELFQSIRGFRAPLHIACEIEGIEVAGRHRAAADARLTWALARGLAAQVAVP